MHLFLNFNKGERWDVEECNVARGEIYWWHGGCEASERGNWMWVRGGMRRGMGNAESVEEKQAGEER